MKRMLDLFSGLKGWSQAFEKAGDWEIISVDILPELNPTIVCDVSDLWNNQEFLIEAEKGFDLIVASPPCIEFFKVLAPWRDEYKKNPSMQLVEDTFALIKILQPKYWVIENTQSGSIFINDYLGNYRQKIGPFFFWGKYPLFDADVKRNHKKNVDSGPSNPLRSNIRAKIPFEISAGLKDVIENQKSLCYWFD